MDEHYLLVGLGNPGVAYENTRHNLGFMIVDALTRALRDPQTINHASSHVLSAEVNGKSLLLAKPMTYMNKSGVAIADLVDSFKISLNRLLIIVDDFNLPFGQLRLRPHGTDGGHNGLESIIRKLETALFPRLRIGIGQERLEDPVAFVLGEFDQEEKEQLHEIIERAAGAALNFVQNGITDTMNKYNQTTN